MVAGSHRRATISGVVTALLLTAGGVSLRARWAPDFYSQRFDNAPLAMGQALNLEMASRGALPRPIGYYQIYHPGLPFQVASWLSLRLGGGGAEDPFESALGVLEDPSGFWAASGAVAALLTLTGLALILYAARRAPPVAVAAAMASFFCLDSSWVSGFLVLNKESFALPLAALLLVLARRTFESPDPDWRPLAGAGMVAAVAYLSKLPYLIWTGAVGMALLTRVALAPAGARGAWLRGTLVFSAGWLAAFGALAAPLMSPASLVEMLRLHLGTATHSGYHTTGAEELVSLEVLRFSLSRLPDHPLFLAVVALLAVGGVRAAYLSERRERTLPLAVLVGSTLTLSILAVLKHYKVYYLLVGLSFVPVATVWLLGSVAPAWRNRLAVALLALCAGSFASQIARPPMDMVHWSRYVPWQGAADEIAAIEALPLGPGEVRAWSYGCVGPGYYRQFASAISGYASLLERVRAEYPRDRSVEEPHLDWRYAIFEWNLIDSRVDDPLSDGLLGGLRATARQFLAHGEVLPGFKRYLVIERRREGDAPAGAAALPEPPAGPGD